MSAGDLVKDFLTPERVDAATAELRSMTRGKLVLIGGLAMQAYGSDRLTKDIDFMARSVPEGFNVERRLSFGGVAGTASNGVKICIVVRSDGYKKLYDEALRETRGPIVEPEYLAVMKLVAGRPKDEEDLRTLIRKKAISVPRAKQIAEKFFGKFGSDSIQSYVTEVEWMKSKGEE